MCGLTNDLPGEVIIVLDNCGLEFVADLVLVDGLLRCGQNKVCAIHEIP